MTDMIQTLFRTVLLAALAIAGFTLAIIVMLGTALVIGFLYLRAKITGKPFLGQAMWARRPTAARWGFPRQPGATGQSAGTGNGAHAEKINAAPAETAPNRKEKRRF